MFNPLLILIVAASAFAAVVLTRQWVLEHRGVDLDKNSMEIEDVQHFTNRQKLALAALLTPVLIFLIVSLAYVLAAVVVTALGVSAPSA